MTQRHNSDNSLTGKLEIKRDWEGKFVGLILFLFGFVIMTLSIGLSEDRDAICNVLIIGSIFTFLGILLLFYRKRICSSLGCARIIVNAWNLLRNVFSFLFF